MISTVTDYFMSSERIGFRWWRADDLPHAMEIWGNPEVTRFFNRDALTPEQVAHKLEETIATAERHHIQYWPMFLLEDGTHIGCAGLRPHANDGVLEMGVYLKPQYWGRGFAVESCERVISHAFESGLTTTLFAGHHPDNHGSRNALRKLGFLGITAEFYEPTGMFHPSYLMYKDPPAQCSMRLATARDAHALALVHHDSIKATFGDVLDAYVAARSLDACERRWLSRIENEAHQTVVLLRGEQIVGFASVGKSPDKDAVGAGEISRIYLHPSLIGQGHGKQMMQWCEETLAACGSSTMKLWVFELNERARNFYEKHGFHPDGCTKHEYDATLLRYSKTV